MDIIEKTIGDVDCDRLELPVGFIDSEGRVIKFVKLKELDGEVEEKILDPKVRDNAGKLITELLFGIIESIEGSKKTKDVIRGLTTIDRDFLVLMNHKISFNNIIKWTDSCKLCGKPNDIVYDMDTLPVRYLKDTEMEFSFTLPKPALDKAGNEHSDITIFLPTGHVQERVSPLRNNPAQANTALLQMITKQLGTLEMPIENDIFKKMSSKNRMSISKYVEELNLGAEIVVDEICSECGEIFSTMIPITALLGE